MKKHNWNFQLDGVNYYVETTPKDVTINPGETYKLRKLSKKGNFMEQSYEIPMQNASCILYIDTLGKQTLVINGVDANTGEQHVPLKMPGWGWVFMVLYIINFIFLLGGALGGALNATLFAVTGRMAANRSDKLGIRILKCVGLYIISTAVELVLAIFVFALINPSSF